MRKTGEQQSLEMGEKGLGKKSDKFSGGQAQQDSRPEARRGKVSRARKYWKAQASVWPVCRAAAWEPEAASLLRHRDDARDD